MLEPGGGGGRCRGARRLGLMLGCGSLEENLVVGMGERRRAVDTLEGAATGARRPTPNIVDAPEWFRGRVRNA